MGTYPSINKVLFCRVCLRMSNHRGVRLLHAICKRVYSESFVRWFGLSKRKAFFTIKKTT